MARSIEPRLPNKVMDLCCCALSVGFPMKSKIRLLSTSFLLLIFGLLFSAYPLSAAAVSVPNVVGQPQATATATISGTAGLGVGNITQQSSVSVPVGYVISQNPVGGINVPDPPSNTLINLVVSSGSSPPTNIAVPNVVGQTQGAAGTVITSAGLTVGAVSLQSNAAPAGTVISQTPAAGTLVGPTSPVNLVVSLGPVPVAVPNVIGLLQSAAVTTLQNLGLNATIITTTTSPTLVQCINPPTNTTPTGCAPPGRTTVVVGVVSLAAPDTGSTVAPGAFVTLTVYSPNTGVIVPNVIGLPQNLAINAIQDGGLAMGTVTYEVSATVPAGNVISQDPVGGVLVGPDPLPPPVVSIVVSTGPNPPATVPVPNVVGQTQGNAIAAIQAAGLAVSVTQESSATVPAGSVISQNPVGGTNATLGSTVAIVVSSGLNPPANTVPVPNVVNLTQAAAITAIQAVGLTVGSITQAASPTVPAGSVISQSPAAGINANLGSAVDIVVSSGPNPPGTVPVPNVVGQTQGNAIAAIQGAGLTVGTITQATSATVLAGNVISQDPLAGINVALGSPVSFVVSSGAAPPTNVLVPNVVGSTQAAAIAAIQAVGLTVGIVTQASSATVPAGNVISQNPLAGINVALGSPVSFVVSSGAAPPTNVLVPNVVGQTQAAAIAAIQAVGLTVTVTTQASFTVPAGTVISQNPVGGVSVAIGSPVTIVVSSGSGLTATVPDVVGKTQAEAVAAIQAANLTVTVTTQASFTVPAGTVISQDPIGGVKVAPGSAVAIVVSSGSGLTATVPNVVGLTQSAAVTAIQAANLIATVTFQTSTTVAAGIVISQDPVGGVKVAPGSAVTIVVSSGFNPITVPNVVGQPLASAKTAITGACSTSPAGCLTVGGVTLQASATVPAGSVINQNPIGGTQVPPNTAVNLVVSSGKEAPVNPPYPPGAIEVPNVKGLTQTAAANIIRNAGLSVGAVLKQYSDTVPAGIVMDQSPAAGAKVAVGTPVTLTVSLGPAGVVKVPDVRGLPEEVAKATLQNAGLTISKTMTQPDPTMPAGNAISTDPAAGTQVKIGSSVILIISTGFSQPQEVAVPGEVIGMTVEDARESLFAVGLFHVGAITVQSHATIPAGRVSGLNPTAGTMVAYGTTINLFVSSGSQAPVQTPNVVGLTLAEATVRLNAAGLQVGFVSRQTSNTVEAGRVISQNPLMTALVPVGWKINLVVSLGPVPQDPGARPTTQVPDVVGLSLAAATAKLINAGLQIGIVANERSQDAPAGQVIRQNPPSAVTLPVSGKVNLVVSFGPHAYTLLSGPAYITNYAGGTVSIINPDINAVVDNIPSGINNIGPSGIAVHPDGTRLYVTNRPKYGKTNGTLSVIDLTERKVIAVIPVGIAPLGVAINPTGERVFVANEGSFSLSVIDTSTNQPFIDLNVPNLMANSYPRGVAVHPNPLQPLVYVTNRTVNSFSDDDANPQPDQCDALVARPPINVNPDQCVGSLSIFDADLKTQVGSVAVGWAPEGVAVHPNGQYVYVANSGDRTVSVIETVFNRVIGIIALDEFGGAPQPLVPRGVAVSPDGQRLYVTDGASDRLFVIDTTANHAVVGIVPLRLDKNPRTPYGVSVSPDNRRVYVANTATNTVSVVGGWNAAEGQVNKVIAEIPVGEGPWAFGQFMGPLATVAAPTFTPPAGAYRTGLKVTLTSATAGASIRYTTDGSTPTPTSGMLIANGQAITLDLPSPRVTAATITVKAIAFKEGWMESEVTEAAYTLRK